MVGYSLGGVGLGWICGWRCEVVPDMIEAEGLVVCFVEGKDGGVPHVEVGHEGVG